jgi:hypothetical protein
MSTREERRSQPDMRFYTAGEACVLDEALWRRCLVATGTVEVERDPTYGDAHTFETHDAELAAVLFSMTMHARHQGA